MRGKLWQLAGGCLLGLALAGCALPEGEERAVRYAVAAGSPEEQCELVLGWADDEGTFADVVAQPPWEHAFTAEGRTLISLTVRNGCASGAHVAVTVDEMVIVDWMLAEGEQRGFYRWLNPL